MSTEPEERQMNRFVERLVRPVVRDLQPYQVPPSDGLIKLDAMENPYPLPPELQASWKECLASVHVNRYPDPGAEQLQLQIRDTFDVPDACDILLGNGSDELIQMLALLVGGPGRVFLAPSPSFSMYRMISLFTSTGFQEIPLEANCSLSPKPLLDMVEETRPAVVFFAYPNNPTGNCFDENLIREVLLRTPGLVIVDEAYFSFCGRSFLCEVPEFPNLLVLRTLSKSGLAGLRLGILVGQPQWVAELDKVRLPYNINSLSQAGARFCLEHHGILEEQARWIRMAREDMREALKKVPGVMVYPSEANFLLIRVSAEAEMVFAKLKERGVLVKNLHQSGRFLDSCLRITVGTAAENRTFLYALRDVLGEQTAT